MNEWTMFDVYYIYISQKNKLLHPRAWLQRTITGTRDAVVNTVALHSGNASVRAVRTRWSREPSYDTSNLLPFSAHWSCKHGPGPEWASDAAPSARVGRILIRQWCCVYFCMPAVTAVTNSDRRFDMTVETLPRHLARTGVSMGAPSFVLRYLFIYLCIYLFIYLCVCLCIYLFTVCCKWVLSTCRTLYVEILTPCWLM